MKKETPSFQIACQLTDFQMHKQFAIHAVIVFSFFCVLSWIAVLGHIPERPIQKGTMIVALHLPDRLLIAEDRHVTDIHDQSVPDQAKISILNHSTVIAPSGVYGLGDPQRGGFGATEHFIRLMKEEKLNLSFDNPQLKDFANRFHSDYIKSLKTGDWARVLKIDAKKGHLLKISVFQFDKRRKSFDLFLFTFTAKGADVTTVTHEELFKEGPSFYLVQPEECKVIFDPTTWKLTERSRSLIHKTWKTLSVKQAVFILADIFDASSKLVPNQVGSKIDVCELSTVSAGFLFENCNAAELRTKLDEAN